MVHLADRERDEARALLRRSAGVGRWRDQSSRCVRRGVWTSRFTSACWGGGMNLRKRIVIATVALFPDGSQAAQVSAEKSRALLPAESVHMLGVAPAPETRRQKPRKVTNIGVVPAPPPRSAPFPRPKPSTAQPPPKVMAMIADWGGLYVELGATGIAAGGLSGVTSGIDFQQGRAVFGIGAGYERAIVGSASWIATASGKFGYVVNDRLLPFVKVGLAYGGFADSSSFAARYSALGFKLGVGFDYRVDANWSATGAVDFYSFPADGVLDAGPRQNFVSLHAGLKYRLAPTWSAR